LTIAYMTLIHKFRTAQSSNLNEIHDHNGIHKTLSRAALLDITHNYIKD